MPELDDVQQRVEVNVWEQAPDKPQGTLRCVRSKTVREVYDEICAIVGEYPDGGDEYFTIMHGVGGEIPWPGEVGSRIVCFSVNGSSEGDYTHVEVHHGDGTRTLVFLGKTFMGRDASWAFARRLADILEWQ